MMELVKFYFFCVSLISAATFSLAEGSRHGKPISDGVFKDKAEDKREENVKILRPNEPLILEHVVNICHLEPGAEDRPELTTHLEFYPCYESGRGEVKIRNFLAKAAYYTRITSDQHETETKQYLDICDKNEASPCNEKANKIAKPIVGLFCKVDQDPIKKSPEFCRRNSVAASLSPDFPRNIAKVFEVNVTSEIDNEIRDKILCDKKQGKVRITFQLTIKVEEGKERGNLDAENLIGIYVFKTKHDQILGPQLPESVFSVRGDRKGLCGRTGQIIPTSKPNTIEAGIVAGSFFVGGFILIVFIAITYYCYQWRKVTRKKKKLEDKRQILTSQNYDDDVIPRDETPFGSAPSTNGPEPGEIPASGRGATPNSASNPTYGLSPSTTPALPPYSVSPEVTPQSESEPSHAPSLAPSQASTVSFSAEESAVRIRKPQVRIQRPEVEESESENPVEAAEKPDIRTPSFTEFCDHPAVVVAWCVLVVANATALIVGLSLLPITHPIETIE